MSKGQKILWLFTTRFPYGTLEPFLENELPVLCRHFKQVLIVPQFKEDTIRPVPENASIRMLSGSAYGSASLWELVSALPRLIDLWRSVKKEAPSPKAWRDERRALLTRIRQALHRATKFERELLPELKRGRDVLYAYWTDDWVTALSLARAKHAHLKFISRAHGFDLYEHQRARGWIPFRAFQLKHVDRIYTVSQAGQQHLAGRYPAYLHKFRLARLGTTDHGLGPYPDPTSPLRIVSCAHLIPRKRVSLWLQVLQQVTVPVEWTHFGDGPQRKIVEQGIAALPPNVTAELQGHKNNAQVMAWYKANPVHLFVLFSELEGGVAVSAQEAASFGIPILATDSGGIRDLMNERTGELLPTDPDVKEAAQWIDHMVEDGWTAEQARKGVRDFWEENFHADRSFTRFCIEELQSNSPLKNESSASI